MTWSSRLAMAVVQTPSFVLTVIASDDLVVAPRHGGSSDALFCSDGHRER
jgi:hypothetical protein